MFHTHFYLRSLLPELDYNGWGTGTFQKALPFRKSEIIEYDSIFSSFVLQKLVDSWDIARKRSDHDTPQS